jgi:histidinol dehydrogenase
MIRILASKDMGRLLARRTARLTEAEATVRPILEAIRRRGDKGLLEFARKFDRLERKSVRVPPRELAEAAVRLTPEFRSAVQVAATNVRRFAEKQLPREYTASFGAGLRLGQIVRPLDTVGAYIPAGRYPLPSTLIMTAVPAQVAGVKNISS